MAKVCKRYGKDFDPYRWEFMNLLERLNERLRARDECAVVMPISTRSTASGCSGT